MSTGTPPGPDAAATPPGAVPVYNVPPPGTGHEEKVEFLRVYGHSNLLYWWPVWAVSFILAGVTFFTGDKLAVVPAGTVAVAGATVNTPDGPAAGPRDILLAPAGSNPAVTDMTVSRNPGLGVIFVLTLLLVAVVSSLTLRGLVSLIVIIGLVAVAVALALFDLWNPIFAFFGGLHITMNAAGYLFIGVPLFLLWLFVVFVYDKQVYMEFDEGQLRYVLDVGDSAIVAPAEGAIVEKKRDDVFRHWLIGFGTGDIVVRTGDGRKVELENVIGIGRKLRLVNDLIRHKPIVVSEG